MKGKSIITRHFHLNIKEIFSYIFFLYFIYSTDSFYGSTFIKTGFFTFSKYVIVICGCIGFIKTLNSNNIWLNCLFAFSFISIACIGGYSGGVVFKFLLLFAGFLFANIYGWDEFKKKYIEILSFISVYSIICFIFSKGIGNCHFFPIVENVGHVQYKDLIFSHVPIVADYQGVIKIWRNYGPFWEPGVYQIYLILGFIFVAFDTNSKRLDITKMVLFGVTIFTTFSTAGFISLAVVLIAFLFKKNYIKEKALIVIIICLGLFILFSNDLFINMIFGKLIKKDASSSSRFDSLLGGLYITVCNPLGTGPYLFLAMMKDWGYDGNTNGFIQHFAILGWLFGFWYVYRLFNFAKCIENKNIMVTSILFLAIIMGFCNEPIFYSLPFSTVIFYKPLMRKNYINIQSLITPSL